MNYRPAAYCAAMRNLVVRKELRDALGQVVLGGYAVRVYAAPVATLQKPLPPPNRRGLLFFDYDDGVMVLW
jgi:hypothetical protein